jgi:hypothetical protein
MSTYGYHQILDQIQQLALDEQHQLLKDLEAVIRRSEEATPLYDIMEFEGIAKELWKDVDVQKYLEEERNSWERDVREPRGADKETLKNVDVKECIEEERNSWERE